MFQIGERVRYGTEGVCTVVEIREMKVSHQRARYYVLQPVNREGATVFVPLDNEALVAKMRTLLSAQQIEQMLAHVAQEEPLWVENPVDRKAEFGRILLSGDRYELLRMIRSLYETRRTLGSRGRRLRAADEQLLRDAERAINDEFAAVLGIPPREVPEYIRSKIAAQD